jgi:intein/homing endonuclease
LYHCCSSGGYRWSKSPNQIFVSPRKSGTLRRWWVLQTETINSFVRSLRELWDEKKKKWKKSYFCWKLREKEKSLQYKSFVEWKRIRFSHFSSFCHILLMSHCDNCIKFSNIF